MTDLTNMTEDELMTALKIATDISRDLRVWAATPDPHGMVPIHPETALQIADEIKRLWAERAEAKRYVTMRHGMKGTASLLRMTVKMQAEEIERLRAELAETIAAFPLGAVKAERERCAKIAETTEREGFGGGAYNEAGRDIAAAIRKQP